MERRAAKDRKKAYENRRITFPSRWRRLVHSQIIIAAARRTPRSDSATAASCSTHSDLFCGLSRLSSFFLWAVVIAACHRENRYFEPPPASDASPTQLQLSPLVAGRTSVAFREQQRYHYEENAHHVSEGKRLFSWFNCSGCHAHGGGDSGPPLMDDQWIYGGEIDQIYLTIFQGRPNGMPAFGGKIPEQQIWQLAAYVRTMSGHGTKEARTGRDDHIQKPSEQSRRQEALRGEASNLDH